ncbi:MAG: hypothetical protein NTW28_04055 [Candidatus Solibacter sp.]|nr:hypothetical protein [Candidatus Solibacter sp.]
MLLGFVIAASSGSAAAMVDAADRLLQQLDWRNWGAEPEVRQALIVTANRRDQLTVVATLSPRGFTPLLASSGREVLSQIRAHPGTLKLAVVDATLPEYAFIADSLKNILPVGSIIVLSGSEGPQDIGPMLLDRLGGLESLNRRGRRGSARGSPSQLEWPRLSVNLQAADDWAGSGDLDLCYVLVERVRLAD